MGCLSLPVSDLVQEEPVHFKGVLKTLLWVTRNEGHSQASRSRFQGTGFR